MADTGSPLAPLVIDRERRAAFWGDRRLDLTSRAFDLVACLADNPGRVVPKSELRATVWRDAHVDEANLTQTVFMLRRALREAGAHPDLVLTVPRVGYRLAPAPTAQATPRVAAALWRAAWTWPAGSPSLARSIALTLAGLALVTGVALWLMGRTCFECPVRSVALVPFTNLLGPSEQFLVDTLTDRFARDLARVTPVQHASDSTHRGVWDPQALGRALDVDAVLTGRVEPRDGTVAISAALTDTRSGRAVWRAHRTGPPSPAAWVQVASGELVTDLVRTTWPNAPPPADSGRDVAIRADLVRAQSLLARGTPDALPQAIAAFRDAIARDPRSAEGYAGLADAYTISGITGVLPRRTAYPTAKQHALEALEIDEHLAEAHSSLGLVLQAADKRWADAELRYQRAIALDPTGVTARRRYARLLDATARPAEALREIDLALAIAPASADAHADKGVILAHQHRVDEAIAQFQRTLAIDPGHADAAMEMGWVLARAGRHAEALSAFARADQLGADRGLVLAARGYTLARAGKPAEARAVFREIEGRRDILDLHRKQLLQATVLMGLGETDAAMQRLLSGAPDGEPDARVGYWELHAHPGYSEFLRRSGF